MSQGDKIGEGYVEARLDNSRIDRDTDDLQQSISRSLDRTGQRMQQTGRTLTRRITAPLVAMGGTVLTVAGNFESSMNRVGALTGAVGGDFDRLSDRAKELGSSTQFSAAQAAEGMSFLAMAGFEVNEIYDAMPGVLNLAAAGQIELAQAADIASNVLTGMGMDVSELDHVVDVLAATITSSNTSMGQLGDSMSYVAPIASAAGATIEETAAAIGLMGDAGIQGSTAGAALRMAMGQLLNPTGAAASALERLGVNATEADGTLRPLHEIVRQLEDAGADAGDMMTIFGQRAGPAMAALVARGGDALEEFTARLEESGGTAEQIADRQMEGLNGALARMRSAAEGAAIALGESGLISYAADFAESIAGAFAWLAQTNPELLNFAVIAAGVAASAGPAAWAVGGMVRGFAAILAIANPVTVAIAAAAAAVGYIALEASKGHREIGRLTDQLTALDGAMGDRARAVAEQELVDLGAAAAARDLGIAFSDVVDAATGVPGAFDNVRGAAQNVLDEYLALLTSGGDVSESMTAQAHAAETIIGALDNLSPRLEEASQNALAYERDLATAEGRIYDVTHATEMGLTNAMYNLEAAHGEAAGGARENDDALAHLEQQTGLTADQLAEAGVDVGLLAGDFDDLEGSVSGATSALSDHAAELRAQSDPLFALRRAVNNVADAEETFTKVLGDNEASQREVEDAALDLMEAQLELMHASGEAAGTFDGKLDPAMRNSLQLMGASEDQIAIIEAAFGDAAEAGDGYAKDYEAQVRVENQRESMQRFRELERAAQNASRNRTATIGVRADLSAFNRAMASATGRGDPVPFLASGGTARAGRLHVVGEEGPELFVPDVTGTVIDAARTAGLMMSGPSNGPDHSTEPVAASSMEMSGQAPSGHPLTVVLDGRQHRGTISGEGVVEALREYERRNGAGWRS